MKSSECTIHSKSPVQCSPCYWRSRIDSMILITLDLDVWELVGEAVALTRTGPSLERRSR